MTTPAEPAWWPLIDALATCLCTQLADTLGGPVARCCAIPGSAVVIDDCCNGTAWVRLDRMDTIPAGDRRVPVTDVSWGGRECGPMLARLLVGLGVMRCAATVDENGNPPACDTLSQESKVMFSDIDALFAAALCCDAPVEVVDASPQQLVPQGPAGGCAGAELIVAYTVDLCPCAATP